MRRCRYFADESKREDNRGGTRVKKLVVSHDRSKILPLIGRGKMAQVRGCWVERTNFQLRKITHNFSYFYTGAKEEQHSGKKMKQLYVKT